jgi:hypothetical protein
VVPAITEMAYSFVLACKRFDWKRLAVVYGVGDASAYSLLTLLFKSADVRVIASNAPSSSSYCPNGRPGQHSENPLQKISASVYRLVLFMPTEPTDFRCLFHNAYQLNMTRQNRWTFLTAEMSPQVLRAGDEYDRDILEVAKLSFTVSANTFAENRYGRLKMLLETSGKSVEATLLSEYSFLDKGTVLYLYDALTVMAKAVKNILDLPGRSIGDSDLLMSEIGKLDKNDLNDANTFSGPISFYGKEGAKGSQRSISCQLRDACDYDRKVSMFVGHQIEDFNSTRPVGFFVVTPHWKTFILDGSAVQCNATTLMCSKSSFDTGNESAIRKLLAKDADTELDGGSPLATSPFAMALKLSPIQWCDDIPPKARCDDIPPKGEETGASSRLYEQFNTTAHSVQASPYSREHASCKTQCMECHGRAVHFLSCCRMRLSRHCCRCQCCNAHSTCEI